MQYIIWRASHNCSRHCKIFLVICKRKKKGLTVHLKCLLGGKFTLNVNFISQKKNKKSESCLHQFCIGGKYEWCHFWHFFFTSNKCFVFYLPSEKGSTLNSFPASGDLCCLLITFANSLDPDQARQNVGPDLDPNFLTLWWYSWKFFFKKS